MNMAEMLKNVEKREEQAEPRREAGEIEYQSWFVPSPGELEYRSWLGGR
jgi:hypothetical protein